MALEISHLVVNGCSFTYCQGLYDPPNEGWPRLLANKLGVPVVNLAIPGSSNDGVHRRTYDYYYKNLSTGSKPFYIIAMTMNIRTEAYVTIGQHEEKVYDYVNLSAIDDLELSKAFYYHMDKKGIWYSQGRKLRYWSSLINLFDSNKTPYLTGDYMPTTDGDIDNFVKKEYPELDNFIRTHPNTLRDFCNITAGYPKALDNGHDGPEAQVALADFIYSQLIRRYGEVKPIKTDYLSLKNFRTCHEGFFDNRNQWYLHEIGKPYHYGLN